MPDFGNGIPPQEPEGSALFAALWQQRHDENERVRSMTRYKLRAYISVKKRQRKALRDLTRMSEEMPGGYR